ncbi:hypothetical protein ACFQDF_18175 [Ectobacillus funiculus]|uniref:Uncharacterized protein n=1 Tax=Ectobacillus funiculus TaxID=137993 RepID=A0ABV5WAF4_9BACI
MVPVVIGPRETPIQSLIYMILLFVCSIVFYINGNFNIIYLAGAIMFNSVLLCCT